MIRDDELHNSLDYSEGQREAAHRILVELVNLFNDKLQYQIELVLNYNF